jgi:hypothetical protein
MSETQKKKRRDFMKKLFLAALIAVSPLSAFAQVTTAKVAELTAHRIDRLVQLKKIDATFNTKLETLEVQAVNGPAPVAFRSVVSQTMPPQGAPLQVELLFDAAGKPLSFKAIAGGVAGPDPGYNGGKDAVSLLENSLHEVLENATDAKIAPFYNGLATVTLTKGKLSGMDVSQAHITSSATTSKLNVYLMLDGMFMSSEVVP